MWSLLISAILSGCGSSSSTDFYSTSDDGGTGPRDADGTLTLNPSNDPSANKIILSYNDAPVTEGAVVKFGLGNVMKCGLADSPEAREADVSESRFITVDHLGETVTFKGPILSAEDVVGIWSVLSDFHCEVDIVERGVVKTLQSVSVTLLISGIEGPTLDIGTFKRPFEQSEPLR